jgi:mannose-6-phosphate isomerase
MIIKPSCIDHRPWGFFEILTDGENHKVKRITIYPGHRLSHQRHQRRLEHWVFVAGRGTVLLEGNEVSVAEGDSLVIPQGAAHRVTNPEGGTPLVFIEVQRGDYLGEDDIVRLDDDYGRVPSP